MFSQPAIRQLQQRIDLRSLLSNPQSALMLATFSVYCFVYPFAILLMSFDWMPFGMEWMSSLLLAMLGFSCWAWLWANLGSAGLLLGTLIFGLGVGLEYMGVLTGFPFGSYRYTGVLVPELPGGVPLAIGFAWLLVIVGGLLTARRVIHGSSTGIIVALSIAGGVLTVGLDLLLEPVAYHVKDYWQWIPGDGSYYGIPTSNFVAWFAASTLFNLPLAWLWVRRDPSILVVWPWLPTTLFVMNVIMFGIVCVSHGFWLAGLVGVLLLVQIYLLRPSRR